MVDFMAEIVFSVSYIGLCAGTYISVSGLNVGLPKKISIALFAPIPVFMVLAWIATSIAFERFKTLKEFCRYPLLLAMSLSMYADAIAILFIRSAKKSKNTIHITEYKYKVPIIRKAIATNYVAV